MGRVPHDMKGEAFKTGRPYLKPVVKSRRGRINKNGPENL